MRKHLQSNRIVDLMTAICNSAGLTYRLFIGETNNQHNKTFLDFKLVVQPRPAREIFTSKIPWTMVFMLFTFFAFSQSYNMDGTNITDCSGFFYDSGGSTGNYGNSENLTTTICSDGSSGTHVQLVFSAVDLAGGDMLCFFDGPTSADPALSCNTDFAPGNPFIIQATAANTSGCLTITFNSDGTGDAAGWQADMNCVPSCQIIEAILSGSDPAVSPVDTGYIDICPGDRVFFNGTGNYPQNGIVYQHSDLTSTFEWDFGDGVFGLGPNVSHIYTDPGGYIVQLTITDQFGCTNTNFITQRVRVSTYPDFNIFGALPDQICAGDSISLNAVVNQPDSSYTVGVIPTEGSFQTAGVRSDSLALPDGTGASYETSIAFANFSPGQVLTSVNDLVSICVVMEHSWMRDLEISIQCPDGTSVILHDHPGNFGGEVFLGEPNTADENLPEPIPGVGYEYCWTPNATNGTWLEYANGTFGANGSGTLPPGNYNSFDPLSNLLGCPLNGEWTIHVQDLWGIDNGFIFEWSIEFASDLYQNIETFTPEIVSFDWVTNPSIYFQTNDSIAASPQNAGSANYIFQIEDSFGCAYDTSLSITVLPPTHPDCYTCPEPDQSLEDEDICEDDQIQLDATNTTSLANQDIIFESFPNYPFGNLNHPGNNPYAAPMEVNSINPPILTNALQQICGVCVNIETDFDADIRIFLRSPSGELLELSTNNGGAGDNYTGTCFTPLATDPISFGSAPFTGDFTPEGTWNSLNGSTINGTWHLLVSDDFGVNDIGELVSWSICFNNENNITYEWTPGTDLSCTDCPDPIASPTVNTVYQVEISDDFGCVYTDEMEVNVVGNTPAPTDLVCDTMYGGNIVFTWEPVPGITEYQVNVNGTGWITANGGGNTHIVGGLTNGTEVTLEVRVDIGSADCGVGVISATCTYFVCDMYSELGQVTAPTCFNTEDGSATINAFSGQSPFFFSLDNKPAQLLGTFNDVTTGDHIVIVQDNEGCADTVLFNIPVTDSIWVETTADPVSCNGGTNGTATIEGFGGVGNFTYAWNTTPATTFAATITDVPAGIYSVTATDGNNCEIIQDVEILQPDALGGTITPTFVSCNEGNDGAAFVNPSGGVGNYTYLWSDNQTGQTASFLVAGIYTVTITDGNDCTFETSVDIFEPTGMEITIDSIDVNCFDENNGSILLEITGGTLPYTFIWNDNSTDEDRTDLTADVYCVTVTDGGGCSKERCITIDQPTEITLTMSATPASCLDNSSGTATAEALGGVGSNYTYLWNNNQTTSTAQNLTPGNYCVTVTDANGCEAIGCTDVVVPLQVLIDSVEPTDVLCNGDDSGAAEVFVSGGDGNFSYLWSDPLGQFENPANNLSAGTYTVMVTDGNGCTAIGSVEVNEPTGLTTSVTPVDVNCLGGMDGTAVANPSGGTGPYTYEWNSTPIQTTQTAINLPAGNYNVIVTDNNGCTFEETTFVDEPTTAVSAVATQSFTGCFGANNSAAEVTPSGGTGTNYTFQWSNTPSSNTATAINLAPQNYTVTVTDGNGCEATTSVLIGELDEITVNIIEVEPTCFGDDDGQLGINIVTGGIGNGDLNNYNYSWDNGTSNPLNSNLSTGSYSVTVSDAQGCSAVEIVNLDQPVAITATANVQDALCFGSADGEIIASAAGDFAPFSYLWDANANNQNTDTASGVGAGIYGVTITDDMGCTIESEFVVGQPKEIEVSFETEDNPCSGDNVGTISTTVDGGTPDYSFQWSDTSNTFSSINQNLTDLQQSMYIVTITDANNCELIDSIFVDAPPALWAQLDEDSVTCFGDQDGSIFVTPQGGVGPFTFSIDGENFGGNNNFIGLEAGGYTVFIQDGNDCQYELNTEVGGPEEIVADLGDDININMGELAELKVDVTPPGNYFYSWSPSDSLTCDDCQTTYAQNLLNQTSFQVVVTDEFGCTAKDYVTVFVRKYRRVYVPTGFAPNGNALNQVLRTHGEEGTIVKTFRVYSRWGELVWENAEPYPINSEDIGWDGVFKGKEMNPGVFVWYLEVEYIDGASDLYKGNTTLIR